jgi:hypothetical protein
MASTQKESAETFSVGPHIQRNAAVMSAFGT